MSILKIARMGHPILFQKTEAVKDVSSKEVIRIIHDMTETMLDANGIGLAAPQVHINKQIIIFRNSDEKDQKEIKITALINPKLIKNSDETENDWEGCLSIPGMLGLVKRFSKIKYEGYDMSGKIIAKEAEGFHARVIQHEYDHLRGCLYINRLANKNAYGFTDEIEGFWKGQKN
jgi:peptide deformylase